MGNQNERLEALTATFAALGAPDPGEWARSEVDEDIPQLARFCFLRSLWPKLIDTWTQDVAWVDRLSDSDTEPFADVRVGLSRMREEVSIRKTLAGSHGESHSRRSLASCIT
jgi:hypothetical protein